MSKEGWNHSIESLPVRLTGTTSAPPPSTTTLNTTLNTTSSSRSSKMKAGQVSRVRLTATAAAPPGPQLVLSHVELQQLQSLVKLQLRGSVGTLGTIGRQDEGAGQTLSRISENIICQSEPNLSSHLKELFLFQSIALVCIFSEYEYIFIYWVLISPRAKTFKIK